MRDCLVVCEDSSQEATEDSWNFKPFFELFYGNVNKLKIYKENIQLKARALYDTFIKFTQPEELIALLWKIPVLLFYFTYLWIPLVIFGVVKYYVFLVVRILCKRSPNLNRLRKQFLIFYISILKMYRSFQKKSIEDIIVWMMHTTFEILGALIFGTSSSLQDDDNFLDEDEDAGQVISYQESSETDPRSISNRRKLKTGIMHYQIPHVPFRVSLKKNKPFQHHTNEIAVYEAQARARKARGGSGSGPMVPGSFPVTPESRAYVINQSLDRTDCVLYRARDLLRIEEQFDSSDDYSRNVAAVLRSKKKVVTFDRYHTSQGIDFACANHCIFKGSNKSQHPRISEVKETLSISHLLLSPSPTSQPPPICTLSSRATLPLQSGILTYIEYTIRTTSGVADPLVSFGIACTDFPLDQLVGCAGHSVGVSSFGCHLNISTPASTSELVHRYRPINESNISSGDTIGLLMYISPASNISVPVSGTVTGMVHQENLLNFMSPDLSDSSSTVVRHRQFSSVESHEDIYTDSPIGIRVSLNGHPLSYSWESIAALANHSWSDYVMYPTVSITSPGTSVWSAFCKDDCLYKSRSSVGAPEGERVYCLDGSLLLDYDEGHV